MPTPELSCGEGTPGDCGTWVMIGNSAMEDPAAGDAIRILFRLGHLVIMPAPVAIEYSPEDEVRVRAVLASAEARAEGSAPDGSLKTGRARSMTSCPDE